MIKILLLTLCLGPAGDGSAITPSARGEWALDRHNHLNSVVQERKGKIDVAFIGDSITQGWEGAGVKAWDAILKPFRPINLGIGGDRTEHLLWRFDNGNLDGINPRIAVIMIGTNNFGYRQDSAEEVYEGVVAVVDRILIKKPQIQVLLLDIFPRGEAFNQMRGEILQVNQALRKTYDTVESVCFFPIGHLFLEDDGTISKSVMPDQLHLSETGYQIWADAVAPQIVKMLGIDKPTLMP